jgi:hypothetical protein
MFLHDGVVDIQHYQGHRGQCPRNWSSKEWVDASTKTQWQATLKNQKIWFSNLVSKVMDIRLPFSKILAIYNQKEKKIKIIAEIICFFRFSIARIQPKF